MFKSNGGFTLVELIVVIAILGLLATVAVPAYSAYIDKADREITDASVDEAKHFNEAAKVWNDNIATEITELSTEKPADGE